MKELGQTFVVPCQATIRGGHWQQGRCSREPIFGFDRLVMPYLVLSNLNKKPGGGWSMEISMQPLKPVRRSSLSDFAAQFKSG
jgi:hypothetical protein